MKHRFFSVGRRPLLILLLPLLMVCIFSGSVFFYQSPGFRVDKTQYGLRISEIHDSINPVLKNDLIIGINGLEYNHVLSSALTGAAVQDNRSSIRVLRENRQIDIPVTLEPVSPFAFLSSAWPHFVLILVLVSLGTLAFLRGKSGQPTGLFLIMVCFFATTFSATFPSHFGTLNPFIISLSFYTLALCNWLAFGTCLHFVCLFPGERNVIRNRKWLIAIIYLAPALIPVIGAFYLSGPSPEFWGWLQRLRNITLPAMAGAAFIKHFVDYRYIRSGIEKNQVKIITGAYWLSFGPYFILYLLPNILFNHPYIPFRFVVISGAILPIAYFISLIKYRLLDVDKMISRTVSYFLIIAMLAFSYSYFVIFLKRSFIGKEIFSEELFLVYVILVALFFEPVLGLISRMMDRLFLPEQICPENRIPVLSREIGTCLRREDLIGILTRSLLKDIQVSGVGLIVMDGEKPGLFPNNPDSRAILSSIGPMKDLFSRGADHFFVGDVSNEPIPDEVTHLKKRNIEIVFALRGGTGINGFWLIGPRNDARTFSTEDVRMFATLANQAGVALENAFHYEALTQSKQQIEKMFAKVAKAEKMAALGEMSTVLAHELKNPLGIIRSSAQFVKKQQEDQHGDAQLLEYIIGEVDGLTAVINNMMGLARYKKPEFEKIDPAAQISSMVQRWQASENHDTGVRINLDIENGLPAIHADLKQLQQVMFNCITNAEQAMPNGGSITIKVFKSDDVYMGVYITDTGPGIPEGDLKNVFEQFFTTREKGMGIGLSVCRQIIGAHNGSIRIENRKEGGLRVRILLPFNPVMMAENADN